MLSIILLILIGFVLPLVASQECGPRLGKCGDSECCSRYSYCGTSSAYCGTGCLSGYGRCGLLRTLKSSGKRRTAPEPSTSPASSSSSQSKSKSKKTSSANTTSRKPPAAADASSTSAPISIDGKCEKNGARCPEGTCCSVFGFCGDTSAHCGAGCKAAWGVCGTVPAAPTSTGSSAPTSLPTSPSSPSPSPSPSLNNSSSSPVTPIRIVTQCATPGTVAITFDDGPYIYTETIVKQFNAVGAKVTFFMNGLNWGCIYDSATEVKLAFDSGHQIGSHTWSHPDIATLNPATLTMEMQKLTVAFLNILGVDPVYMRPPYGSYTPENAKTLQDLGYKVLAIWDQDSGDSEGATASAQQSVYDKIPVGEPAHVVLQHETYATTAQVMVPFIINWAKERKLKMVTLGTCLGDPDENWYRNKQTPKAKDSSWKC